MATFEKHRVWLMDAATGKVTGTTNLQSAGPRISCEYKLSFFFNYLGRHAGQVLAQLEKVAPRRRPQVADASHEC